MALTARSGDRPPAPLLAGRHAWPQGLLDWPEPRRPVRTSQRASQRRSRLPHGPDGCGGSPARDRRRYRGWRQPRSSYFCLPVAPGGQHPPGPASSPRV